MSKIDKNSPFRVPDGYFDNFNENLEQRISSTNRKDGFKTPTDYFQKVEYQILSKINYSKGKNTFISEKLWKVIAGAAVLILFFFNEKTSTNHIELADFFIEDYLSENTTYEIADHSNYYFDTSNFFENYESITIEDALETMLDGETPINLNLFDNE